VCCAAADIPRQLLTSVSLQDFIRQEH
jgi:hypothetical protein